MQHPELPGGEALALEQGDREGVAERHLQGRGGGRGADLGRGLRRVRQQEADVGGASERALGRGRDRDQRDGEAFGVFQRIGELAHLAGFGQDQDHVVLVDHPEVAVAGLGQVHEDRLGARGRQGRGDLARDVAGLAHSHADDAALGLVEQLHGENEGRAQALG